MKAAFQRPPRTPSSRPAESYRPNKADWLDGRWSGMGCAEDDARRGKTGVELDAAEGRSARRITTHPRRTSTPHKTVAGCSSAAAR